jgi:hypothetical protein
MFPVQNQLIFPVSRRLAFALVIVLFLVNTGIAKNKPPVPASDRDYVSALVAANDFLHAWQVQDRAAGVILLSDSTKHRTSEEKIEDLLAPPVGTLQSYEISRGKKLRSGLYSFPVTLFVIGTDKSAKPIRPRSSQIVVIRTGRDDWAIDRLP